MRKNDGTRLRNNLRLLAAIVAAGLLSRMLPTGWQAIDKDLGDALYAAMLYLLLEIVFPRWTAARVLGWAAAIMLGLELFQLTGIPAALYGNPEHPLAVRILARLLGTSFRFGDLLSYAVGLLTIHFLRNRSQK